MGVAIYPPDQTWRLKAACREADPSLFDWSDADEVGDILHSGEFPAHHSKVKSFNEKKFAEAKKHCAVCPVLDDCERDAQISGDYSYTLRGGLSPYDRPGVKVGYPLATHAEALALEHARAREKALKAFRQGTPLNTLSRPAQEALRAFKQDMATAPPDAHWDDFNPGSWTMKPWKAGSGWAVSQDSTRSVVKVMYITEQGLKTRLAPARYIRYDSTTTPRDLLEWQEGLDLL